MNAKHAPTLQSTRVALKSFEKKIAGNPAAAKAALKKLGTHTRTGALSPKYK
jgi:hypothetical protein